MNVMYLVHIAEQVYIFMYILFYIYLYMFTYIYMYIFDYGISQ